MFVLNPDPFLLPAYRLCPFKTDYIGMNSELPQDDFAIAYFNKKFGEGQWHYTYNGREAINLALESYGLDIKDVVTILTTSQNFYISSCVTSTIEKFCKWNRKIIPETKLILVNHEFGYPYPEMEKLVATGLPIIEDCCTTFFSQDEKEKIGKYGDFSTYSFPKFFPIQIGGILVNNTNNNPLQKSILNPIEVEYIQNVLSNQLKSETVLLQKRQTVYEYALQLLLPLGFTVRFLLNENCVPYTLVLNNNRIIKDLNNLKLYLTQNGIQSSVFYGEDAFFIPCHQNLAFLDLDYFSKVLNDFINKE